ncbi:DNA translocase FtsK, partial [Escherichia coli]|nr:DNA translocase FtsK [Escherichia coli]
GLFIWWRSLDFSLPERVSLPSIPSLKGPAKAPLLGAPEKESRDFAEPKIREGREPRKTVVPDNRPGPVIADRNLTPSPARTKPPTQT